MSCYHYYLSAPRPRARYGARRSARANPWVAQFHEDLSTRVALRAGLADRRQAGRLNLAEEPGEAGDKARAEALLRSRVLVPLYCPEYFRDSRCGREWWAFAQRQGAGGDPAAGVVPVLWQPVPPDLLPEAALRVPADHAAVGRQYARDGIDGLIRAAHARGPYSAAVDGLALRIVQRAAALPEPRRAAGEAPDLTAGPSLFGPSPAARELRVLVASCSGSGLPPGRSVTPYGASGLDWSPYRPYAARPLAQEAVRLAVDLDYAATLGVLEPGARPAATRPGGVTLLLLDPWALLADTYRSTVAEFVARDAGGPLAVLVPWNADDPENQAAEAILLPLVREVLAPWQRRRAPQLRALPVVVPDADSFEPTLAQELHRAAAALAAPHRPAATGGSSPARPLPRLRPGGSPGDHDPVTTRDLP